MNTTINFGETKEITFKAGTDTYTRKAEVTDFQYYDDNERLVKIESYDGTLNNYEYHSNGKMKSQELYQNGKLFFKNQFDENGNLVKTANADGTTEELIVEKYSPNRTPLIAQFGDETITFEYDQNGNEIKKATTHVDGKTSVRTKEYDSHGRLILLKSDEREHLIAYDSKGRKVFDGSNQGDANYFVYSDDDVFKLVRYTNAKETFETILENVIENGKKIMCITYKVIK